jgi:hypothetical protein
MHCAFTSGKPLECFAFDCHLVVRAPAFDILEPQVLVTE